jgi:hypothetical protein
MEKSKKLPDAKVVKAFSCVGNAFINLMAAFLLCSSVAMMMQQKNCYRYSHIIWLKLNMGKWKQQEPLNHFVFFGAFPVL